MILVDQTGSNRMRRESRTAHRNIAGRFRLEFSYNVRLEAPLEPCPGRADRLQRRRVHDFFSRLPDWRELHHRGDPMWNHIRCLPDGHRLVHLAPEEIRADPLLTACLLYTSDAADERS